MKRYAIACVVLLIAVLMVWTGTPGGAAGTQDQSAQATIAALQTQVARLSTRVAQLTTPSVTPNASGVVTEVRPIQGVDSVDLETIGTLSIRQGPVESLTVTAEPSVLPKLSTEVNG